MECVLALNSSSCCYGAKEGKYVVDIDKDIKIEDRLSPIELVKYCSIGISSTLDFAGL